MKQSDSVSKLLTALVAAQLKMGAAIVKDASNDVFSSGYATLGAVIAGTKDSLLSEGIVVIQSPGEYVDQKVSVTTKVCHSSGEWLEGTCSAPLEFLDPQGFGSAVSYLRRYAMLSMLGLYQAGSDDDAGSVSARGAAGTGTATGSGSATAGTDEAMKKRFDQWQKNLANADLARLTVIKDTAKGIFTGAYLVDILSSIDSHIAVAKEKDPFTL